MGTFNRLIKTIEKNAVDNKALIPNVSLWAKFWRKEKEREVKIRKK